MRDARRDAHGHLRAARRGERELLGVDGRRGDRDHLGDGSVAHALPERVVVEHVPGAGAGLARSRLHEIGLRPRHLAAREELLAALVVNTGVPSIELRQRDELRLGEGRVGHVATVELVHAGRRRGAALEPETKAVAGAPRVGTEPERRCRPHVALDELRRALEPAGGEDERPVGLGRKRLPKADLSGGPHERLGQAARVEALADGARVPGLVRHHRRA